MLKISRDFAKAVTLWGGRERDLWKQKEMVKIREEQAECG